MTEQQMLDIVTNTKDDEGNVIEARDYTVDECRLVSSKILNKGSWKNKQMCRLIKEAYNEQMGRRLEGQQSKLDTKDEVVKDDVVEDETEVIKEKEITEVTEEQLSEAKEHRRAELMNSDKDVVRQLADTISDSIEELEKVDEEATLEELADFIIENS